ncbi:MAG TPA: tail fiber protein [Xanthomonadales bacterium]|jgi:microcystin-dependent protein|nr:tail fiber protein [Xanthomonadales bacterium]
MSQPYVGEIRMFGGSFAPAGWMFCDGQLLPISEYETLFQLIGTTYGGDGESTFALPDLRGRIPFHQGNGFVIAETAGTESVTLTTQQLPAHSHPLLANSQVATETRPGTSAVPASPSPLIYNNLPPFSQMNAAAISPVGGNQPHENRPPYMVVSFIISMYGIFPSPT